MKKESNRKLGFEKEKLAGEYLRNMGYKILAYNFYSRYGEIDIVAKDGAYLTFVEVKYRSSDKNGLPEESISRRKINRLVKTAQFFLLKHGYPEETACRFDAVVILGKECRVIQDAFEVY